MDCNKGEAMRAKEIALRKFLEKDVVGAAKFAVKAQKLYPELEGISHLVANFDLHMSAKFRRNGEIDWYRMLGVSPSADVETISKQYRKMALLIHPDKNREVGSESAFKLLSEAFRVLKDNMARSTYDQRTNFQPVQQNAPTNPKFVPVSTDVPPQPGYSAAPDWSQFKQGHGSGAPSWNWSGPSPNGCPPQQKRPTVAGFSGAPPRPVNNGRSSAAGTHKKVQKRGQGLSSSTATSDNQDRRSFWTSCTGCKMKHEYLLVYLNRCLRCPTCETAFEATEIPTPSIFLNSDMKFSYSGRENQKSSQMDGSSVATNSSCADKSKAGKPSKKRSNQEHNDANGSVESKRQKPDDNLTRKPSHGRTVTFL